MIFEVARGATYDLFFLAYVDLGRGTYNGHVSRYSYSYDC